MRFRLGGLAGIGVLALALFLPATQERPLELAAPAQKVDIGIRVDSAGTTLVRLHPLSLKATGRGLPLNGYGGVWAFAPDRRILGIAVRASANASTERLRFFGVAGLRRAGKGVALPGPAAALMWVRPDRILAYVNECCPNSDGSATILVIDAAARRVVTRIDVDGAVLQLERSGDSVVLLVADRNRIGPARLVVIDADGRSRAAGVDRITAGTAWPEHATSEPIGTRRIPGLAVDVEGNRAFVVAPDGPAAEVDLGSLAVSYHRLAERRSLGTRIAAWLTPAAAAKGVNGTALTARWLGDGLIAVAGRDERAVSENDGLHRSAWPLGLRILDTRDWSVAPLDGGADSFTPTDGFLLATGSSWSSDSQRQTGMGLAVYAPDRTRRFQLLPGRAVWVGFVYRGRAYVSVHHQSALTIVDLASGRIVGTRRAAAPWPLLGMSLRYSN
jgi:hypothetical protein